jgi:hypothetical protein
VLFGAAFIAVAGCASTTNSTDGSPSTMAQSASPSSAGPVTSTSPSGAIPPPASGELCPTGGAAATGPELEITDPDVRVRLPVGWTEEDLEAHRERLQEFLSNAKDPTLIKSFKWQERLMDEKIFRAFATGTFSLSGAQTSLVISIHPAGATLRETVDRWMEEVAANSLPHELVADVATDLPIGEAYCVGSVSASDFGVPSRRLTYMAELPDGRAIGIGSTAPVGDADFPSIMRSVALSMTFLR